MGTRSENPGGSEDAGWLYQQTFFNVCHSREKVENLQSFQLESVLPGFSKIEMFFEKSC